MSEQGSAAAIDSQASGGNNSNEQRKEATSTTNMGANGNVAEIDVDVNAGGDGNDLMATSSNVEQSEEERILAQGARPRRNPDRTARRSGDSQSATRTARRSGDSQSATRVARRSGDSQSATRTAHRSGDSRSAVRAVRSATQAAQSATRVATRAAALVADNDMFVVTAQPRRMVTRSMARNYRSRALNENAPRNIVIDSDDDSPDDDVNNMLQPSSSPLSNLSFGTNQDYFSNDSEDYNDVEMSFYFNDTRTAGVSDSNEFESDANDDEDDEETNEEHSEHDDIVDLDDDEEEDDEDGNLDDVDEDEDMILDVNLFDACIDVSEDLQEIMGKPKPPCTFNITDQIARRERGASNFQANFYKSRYAVERMTCTSYLRKHRGCVNSLNFSRCGTWLCSGSDDARIVIWDWTKSAVKHSFRSGHTENIFATKFINTTGCLDIVSSSLDGNVRRSFIPPSGGKASRCVLYSHRGPVNKIVISPFSQFEIISAGEDGLLMHKDIRNKGAAEQSLSVTRSLYSVDHHPYLPEICTSGTDNMVRVYDKRKLNKTLHEMYPKAMAAKTSISITSCVYNYNGSEILASYSGQSIYLFSNQNYVPGEHLHHYRGHLNKQTIKGVNYFGPKSEYVISGSDCGNIFFWYKDTEAIMNYLRGDINGVVNCLEPHPTMPVLAVSGLDHSVKLMSPCAKTNNPPDLSKLSGLVEGNLRRGLSGYAPGSDRRLFAYIMRRMIRRNVRTFDFDEDTDHLDSAEADDVGENAAAVAAALEEATPFVSFRDYWAHAHPYSDEEESDEETDADADVAMSHRNENSDVQSSSSIDMENFECHPQ